MVGTILKTSKLTIEHSGRQAVHGAITHPRKQGVSQFLEKGISQSQHPISCHQPQSNEKNTGRTRSGTSAYVGVSRIKGNNTRPRYSHKYPDSLRRFCRSRRLLCGASSLPPRIVLFSYQKSRQEREADCILVTAKHCIRVSVRLFKRSAHWSSLIRDQAHLRPFVAHRCSLPRFH